LWDGRIADFGLSQRVRQVGDSDFCFIANRAGDEKFHRFSGR
jgi:hypothetical protein